MAKILLMKPIDEEYYIIKGGNITHWWFDFNIVLIPFLIHACIRMKYEKLIRNIY